MKYTNRVFTVFFLLLFLTSSTPSVAQKKSITLSVSNASKVLFDQKVIEIPWKLVVQKWTDIDTSTLIVTDLSTKKQIIFQLDINADKQIQNLLVQVSFQPNETKKMQLSYGNRAAFAPKTFGRYVPERKEDFAWENDKIAFRMYGKELEKTPKEMGYGMDVWVKRTEKMILNERYKRGEYHIDHGDGMDYYHVGYSLGAGSMMPFLNDSIYYSKNYVGYTILNNGPLRTTFQLLYDTWTVGANTIKAVKTITLDAGSQFNKITVNYEGVKDSVLQVVAGLVERNGSGVKYADETHGIMTYWEPVHGVDGTTGVACLFPAPVKRITDFKGQLVAILNTNKTFSVTYFAGAVWDRAGFVTTADQWNDYVKKYRAELNELNKILVY